MATLIDDASRVRHETQRLRVELRSLRDANRRELDRSRRRVARVERGLERAAVLRACTVRSAWSSLDWATPTRDRLDDVLVVVDD